MSPKKPLILPNFICIGAQKTGTTTLYHILKDHPEITVSHPRKETKYFYRDEEYGLGLDYYSKFFSYAPPKKAIGEFDPDYLFFDYIPSRIVKDLGKNIKFIVLLRNPIDRAYSQYLMSVKKGFEKLSFEEAIQQENARLKSGTREEINNFSYISRGNYDEQIERYFKYFPKENFLFINYENEFKENLSEAIKRICVFLGIDKVDLKTDLKLNSATKVKYENLTKFIKNNSVSGVLSYILPNKEWRKKIKRAILKWNQQQAENIPIAAELRVSLYNKYFHDSIIHLEKLIDIDLGVWKEGIKKESKL